MSVTTLHKPGSQRGFTLIEVMICLLILAMGMLGMTALQTEVLKYNHAAFSESQAMFLLNDMVERIRANKSNDAYVLYYTETTPTPPVDCLTTGCSTNDMVAWDLYQWRLKVQDQHYLPQGESQIIYDPLAKTFTISVRYDWSHLAGLNSADNLREVSVTTRM